MDNDEIVNPNIYNEEYYFSDNAGWEEFTNGIEINCHPKYAFALNLANIKEHYNVMDIGCGRGELVYFSVKKGANALGIDYSEAAINIAGETVNKLPQHIKHKAELISGDVNKCDFKGRKFDVIFMIDIVEHMYDRQLEKVFDTIRKLLSPKGKLIITTPNDNYEKILYPIKRIMNIPTLISKMIRGKYPAGSGIKKMFGMRDKGQLEHMHVNVLTPGKLREMLKDYKANIYCIDHSKNPLSRLTKKWLGREIVVIATL